MFHQLLNYCQVTSIDELLESFALIPERIDPVRFEGIYLCAFHQDTNPSLHINFQHGIYHCFSCGAKGNLFTLVAYFKGISTKELAQAVKQQTLAIDFALLQQKLQRLDIQPHIPTRTLLTVMHSIDSAIAEKLAEVGSIVTTLYSYHKPAITPYNEVCFPGVDSYSIALAFDMFIEDIDMYRSLLYYHRNEPIVTVSTLYEFYQYFLVGFRSMIQYIAKKVVV